MPLKSGYSKTFFLQVRSGFPVFDKENLPAVFFFHFFLNFPLPVPGNTFLKEGSLKQNVPMSCLNMKFIYYFMQPQPIHHSVSTSFYKFRSFFKNITVPQ
jgi:hypothetical protein